MEIVRVYDSADPKYNDRLAILYDNGTLQLISGPMYGDYWCDVEDMPETFTVVPTTHPRNAIWQHAIENKGCGCSE